MYKIYINDLPLILTDNKKSENFKKYAINTQFVGRSKVLLNYIDLLEKQKNSYGGVVLICDDVEESFRLFTHLFKVVEAAGGIVYNEKGQILFIYRRGHWDLPKGKIDKKEISSDAAIREVSEETGLTNLKLGEHIKTSFHTYRTQKKRILKPTYWFRMECMESNPELNLQEEEDILKAQWLSPEEFLKNYADSTYRNIVDLIEDV